MPQKPSHGRTEILIYQMWEKNSESSGVCAVSEASCLFAIYMMHKYTIYVRIRIRIRILSFFFVLPIWVAPHKLKLICKNLPRMCLPLCVSECLLIFSAGTFLCHFIYRHVNTREVHPLPSLPHHSHTHSLKYTEHFSGCFMRWFWFASLTAFQ